MNDEQKIGKHMMEVDLNLLPPDVSDLYFILSAYKCDDMSLFPTPSVRMTNAECPEHALMEYQIARAGTSEAVVMCSVCKPAEAWIVEAIGQTCSGKVVNYDPLIAAIRSLKTTS